MISIHSQSFPHNHKLPFNPPTCSCNFLPHTQLSPTCPTFTIITLTPPALTAYHTDITPDSQPLHICTHNTQCTHLHPHLYMYTSTAFQHITQLPPNTSPRTHCARKLSRKMAIFSSTCNQVCLASLLKGGHC